MIIYSRVSEPYDPALIDEWLSEAKEQLNIVSDDQDDFITRKLITAISACERYSGLSFITQTRVVKLDRFNSGYLSLPYGPVQSVTSITYKDEDGNAASIIADDYSIDMSGGVTRIKINDTWPDTDGSLGNVEVTYVTGTTADLAPPEAKEAVMKVTVRLYENRGDSGGELLSPDVIELLDLIKVYWSADY